MWYDIQQGNFSHKFIKGVKIMFLFQSNNGGGGNILSLLINTVIIAIVIIFIISLIIFFLPIILIFWIIAKVFGKKPPININNIRNQYQKMNNKGTQNQQRGPSQQSSVDDIIDVSATEVSDKS